MDITKYIKLSRFSAGTIVRIWNPGKSYHGAYGKVQVNSLHRYVEVTNGLNKSWSSFYHNSFYENMDTAFLTSREFEDYQSICDVMSS